MKFSPFYSAPHLRSGDFAGLAARDLSPRRAAQVRHHLETCSVCRAEWEAVQTVFRAAQKSAAYAAAAVPPPDLREHIFAALPAAPAAPLERIAMPVFFVRPLVGASVAAVSVVAALSLGLLYGPALVLHSPRAVAFSEVEAAMQGIKNASWTTETTVVFSGTKRGRLLVRPLNQARHSESFMQVSPPRIAVRQPVYHTGEMGDDKPKRTIYYGNYALSFATGGRNFHKWSTQTLNHEAERTPEEMVRRAVLFPRELLTAPPASPAQMSLPALQVTIKHSPWTSATASLGGKSVVRLQSKTTLTYPASKRRSAASVVTENTVWADPETFRIVRREDHILPSSEDDTEVTTVYDNYRYNVALPSGVFEAPVPPVGKPFVFHDYSAHPVKNWYVSPRDTAQIKTTLEKAARLWNTKQTAKLFQNWDFGFNNTWAELSGGTGATPAQIAEEKRHWQARAEKGIPYKSWRLQGLTVANQLGGGGIYVREKKSDPFPPTGPPANYSATCDVMAVLKPNTRPVPCSMTATFHHIRDTFYITYLNMYDKNMGTGNGIAWRKTAPKP